MLRTTRRRLGSALARSFYVAICLVVSMPLASVAQSADEAALRQFVERFFAAYQNRDLNAFLSLWSEKSPNLADAKQGFERTFAANKLELKSLAIRKITVQEGKAKVRVVVDISAVDAKTGSAVAIGFGKLNRTLDCVKEGEVWKVWQYAPSEEELAAALVSAKTDEERKASLARENEMLTSDLVRAVLEQAVRFSRQGNYPRSLQVYELVVDLATRVGDKARHAAALRGIGVVQSSLGNEKEALEYSEKSVRLAEEVGDKTQISAGLNNIGAIYRSQDNYPRALEYYQRALKIRQEMGDKVGMAPMLTNIGGVHRSLGNLVEAMDYSQNSLKLSEEIGDKRTMATTLISIGIIHNLQGNRTQALEYFQRGLKIDEEIDDKSGVAYALNNIGILHIMQGNHTQALEYYQKVLKVAEEIGSKPLIGIAMGNLGNVQRSLGNFSQALEYQEKGLKIAEELGQGRSIAGNLFNIGLLHYLQDNPVLALEYYQKALRIYEQIGDKEVIAMAIASIGDVYLDRGEYSQALDLGTRGAVIAEQSGARERLSELYIVAGKAYRGLNKPEQARQAFANAIAAVEELRGHVAGGTQQEQRFFEKQITAYYSMVDLLVGQQNFTDAFAYAERVKGRALLDTLQSGRVNITRAMTANEQAEERRLNGEVNSLNIQITGEKVRKQPDQPRLAELEARLTRARLDQERFHINLYAAHPELKVHRGQMQPISLDQAGTLIPDADTALLEYVVAKDKTQLFVLTKRSQVKSEESAATPVLKVYTLSIKEKDLADRVEKFRGRLANQDFLIHEPARELYDLLLGPARAELHNKTNLIIVPDGVLWELPFHALQPAPKRFLIENSAISYAPSLTVLLEMTKSHSTVAVNSPRLLALGNPAIGQQTTKRIHSVLMDERLDPLPEAERQVKELAKLYGPGRSKIYIGPEAQEARVKTEAAGYGILHLAAHGILNDKNPMYSQVVLSQPEGDINEDGMLEAWEVMKLDLKADLVVLSACETARGKVGNGEGMIGLAWAFFVAGVPTTVASQWSVEAASTTELMVEFHRNLERHRSKAESLRQAMLKLLRSKEYNRPFYWAGFVVVGNGR